MANFPLTYMAQLSQKSQTKVGQRAQDLVDNYKKWNHWNQKAFNEDSPTGLSVWLFLGNNKADS